MAGERRVESAREFQTEEPADEMRELAIKINGLLKGQSNNYFLVTMTPGANSTVIPVEFARVGSYANFSPTSQSAADAIALGFVFTVVTDGQITVNHDADAATDRTLGVTLVG